MNADKFYSSPYNSPERMKHLEALINKLDDINSLNYKDLEWMGSLLVYGLIETSLIKLTL